MQSGTDHRLVDLDRRIAALEPPSTLLEAADAIADLAGGENEDGVRYGLARGVILNRMGLPGAALTELQKARAVARGIGAVGVLSEVSREIARVHAWRGETSAAALELLRSVVEADAARDEADMVAAVLEFARLNLETGRYEAALDAFDRIGERLALVPERESSRVPVNRCEALAALGHFDVCLDTVEQTIAALPDKYRRDNFVARLVKARCLGALGRMDAALAAVADARTWMSDDPHSYEGAEIALLDGFIKRDDDPERAIAELERALDRFVDDDLPRHEFDARILLAETLAGLGRRTEAEACLVEGLRRAEVRHLPAMGDRVRAVALRLWRPEMIAEIAPEASVGPGGGSGRFLVLETLGTGGFGEVQRAIDLDTGSEVAIKRLRRSLGADPASARTALDTVRNEVAASARVPNRFVARTRYLSMDSGGTLTLVQDYVPGPTLRQALEGGTLDPGRRMVVAAALARTLAGLHKAGLAHRDLKPDNVILRGGTRPVLIDLGLARLTGVEDRVAGLGTERYAPPEQMSGASTDPRFLGREDVFALGRMIEDMARGDGEPEKKAGMFGLRLGRREAGPLAGPLGAMVATMTITDIARREVDLNALAALLDDAAVGAGT